MTPLLSRHCPKCKSFQQVEINVKTDLQCPECHDKWGRVEEIDKIFDRCPVCGCRQFYTSKDFNQLAGCLIMLIGIILVPVTYGISLPVFALIDFLLHKRVGFVVNCYKCASEFKNLPIPKHFKPFLHHIGLKYDKFR